MALNPSIILSGRTPNFLAIQNAANNRQSFNFNNIDNTIININKHFKCKWEQD